MHEYQKIVLYALQERIDKLEDEIDNLDEKIESQKILLETLRAFIKPSNITNPLDSLIKYKSV